MVLTFFVCNEVLTHRVPYCNTTNNNTRRENGILPSTGNANFISICIYWWENGAFFSVFPRFSAILFLLFTCFEVQHCISPRIKLVPLREDENHNTTAVSRKLKHTLFRNCDFLILLRYAFPYDIRVGVYHTLVVPGTSTWYLVMIL